MSNVEKNSCCGSKLCCPASNHKVPLCICCYNQMFSVLKQLIELVKPYHKIEITVMLNNGVASTFDLKHDAKIIDGLLKVPEKYHKWIVIPINTIAGITVKTDEIKHWDKYEIKLEPCNVEKSCELICEKETKAYIDSLGHDFHLKITVNEDGKYEFKDANIVKSLSPTGILTIEGKVDIKGAMHGMYHEMEYKVEEEKDVLVAEECMVDETKEVLAEDGKDYGKHHKETTFLSVCKIDPVEIVGLPPLKKEGPGKPRQSAEEE